MKEDQELPLLFCMPNTKTFLNLNHRTKLYHELWPLVLNRKAGDTIQTLVDENESRNKKME